MTLLPKLDAWKEKLEPLREARRTQIIGALKTTRGNVTRAAAIVGLDRSRLTILVRELGLQGMARDLRLAARGVPTGTPGARGKALGRPPGSIEE